VELIHGLKTFASLLLILVVVQVYAYAFITSFHYFVLFLIFDDVYLVSDITGFSQ